MLFCSTHYQREGKRRNSLQTVPPFKNRKVPYCLDKHAAKRRTHFSALKPFLTPRPPVGLIGHRDVLTLLQSCQFSEPTLGFFIMIFLYDAKTTLHRHLWPSTAYYRSRHREFGYLSHDHDRQRFVEHLAWLLIETGTDCYVRALISNHFHLLLRCNRVELSRFMRGLLT